MALICQSEKFCLVLARAPGQNVKRTAVPDPDVTGQTRRTRVHLCAICGYVINVRLCVMLKKASYCCLNISNDAPP